MKNTKKEIKYKTKREEEFYTGVISAIMTLFFFITIVLGWGDSLHSDEVKMAVIFFVAGIVYTVYYLTPNCKRKKYAKNGETFAGTIIGAHFFFQGRGEHAYYLIIAFYENGERKLRYSEPYAGSPRCKLRDTSCEVYKWKGKYIEGGFHGLYKGEESKNLPIPISEYHSRNRKQGNYV